MGFPTGGDGFLLMRSCVGAGSAEVRLASDGSEAGWAAGVCLLSETQSLSFEPEFEVTSEGRPARNHKP